MCYQNTVISVKAKLLCIIYIAWIKCNFFEKYKYFHESDNLHQNSLTTDLDKSSFCVCFIDSCDYNLQTFCRFGAVYSGLLTQRRVVSIALIEGDRLVRDGHVAGKRPKTCTHRKHRSSEGYFASIFSKGQRARKM